MIGILRIRISNTGAESQSQRDFKSLGRGQKKAEQGPAPQHWLWIYCSLELGTRPYSRSATMKTVFNHLKFTVKVCCLPPPAEQGLGGAGRPPAGLRLAGIPAGPCLLPRLLHSPGGGGGLCVGAHPARGPGPAGQLGSSPRALQVGHVTSIWLAEGPNKQGFGAVLFWGGSGNFFS